MKSLPMTLSKSVPIVLAIGVNALGEARALEISGTAGYLAEWAVSGMAAAQSTGGREFAGALVWKHVGLCSVSGPAEKRGEISFRISGFGPLSRIDATLTFDGQRCTFGARLSDKASGHMDCESAKGVPLSLSIKR